MRQLIQDPSSGAIQVVELPAPAHRAGTLLVRNVRSAISPGTERATVATARDSYLKTARARPDLVRRVLDTVQREGVLAAYRKVQAKLGEPRALGYSSAGTVIAVGPGSDGLFRVGDRVACCGQGVASHAEIISVPVNLAARIPDGVSFEAAAFATLGAIALHGVRQGDPAVGERWAVIGCGILGLLAVQTLRASGARVAAFDLSPDLVAHALRLGAEVGSNGGTDDQVNTALAWTEGLGVDGVLVTAASANDGPMVAAAGMSRERGRVVAVGVVPFGLPREIAYAKELDLRISRSYGPGRYDAGFEEKGLDYPAAYVRWTETRNLEAFLQLVAEGRMELASLITHRYPLNEAPRAYDALLGGQGPRPLGMVIEYPESPAPAASAAPQVPRGTVAPVKGEIGVAFVGAGAFARAVLLPAFERAKGVRLRHVVTAHGLTAFDAKEKFGFESVATDPAEALASPDVHLVCIATRHDQHADLVVQALGAGKHVFVEKPLALDEDQLRRVEAAAAASSGVLLVGFNRRFSPLTRGCRDALAGHGPILAAYRANAGRLPAGHWLNDPDTGGGRVIGEVCHFVDLLSFLCGDPEIVSTRAETAGRPAGSPEDVVIQLAFSDGSAAQILYTSQGAPGLPKERFEAHAGGTSCVVDDFRRGTIYRGTKSQAISGSGKGHGEEVDALLAAVRSGVPPIPPRILFGVTRTTFRVLDSLREPR